MKMDNKKDNNSKSEGERKYIHHLLEMKNLGQIDQYQMLKRFSEWKQQIVQKPRE